MDAVWDSLGVLGIKAGAVVVRGADRLGRPAEGRQVPKVAGFALGGPIVPLDGLRRVRPSLVLGWALGLPRSIHPLRLLERLDVADRARRVRHLVTRRLPPRPVDDAVPLRVPLQDRRPPLATSVARLALYLLTVTLVASAVVFALGAVAVHTIESLFG
jgi:hypothetical protein